MTTANYFKELELSCSATADDVRTAYKKLAKIWHPDKNHSEGAEDKFKKILEAYNYLKSDDRREIHASEINRAASKKNAAEATNSGSSHARSNTHGNHSQTSTTPHPKTTPTGTKPKDKNWWDSFKQKPKANTNTNAKAKQRPKTGRADERQTPRSKSPGLYAFMSSFMGAGYGSIADPFDEIIFDIFMVSPEKSPPKAKSFTDPFGNKLPKNVDEDIYDWKSATKPPGSQPDYQEYQNYETEFTCHYCGMMMSMDILRKHEPKCLRFGGKKRNTHYQFGEEDINEAYSNPRSTSTQNPQPSPNGHRKIKCQWCGASFNKAVAAGHITECRANASSSIPKRKPNQARPEWNNNFTETEYNDIPQNTVFGQKDVPRQKSPFITIDDFNPFTGGSRTPINPGKACWKCKLEYDKDLSKKQGQPIVFPHPMWEDNYHQPMS